MQVLLAFLVPFLSATSFGVIYVPSSPSALEHLRVGASDGVIFSPRDFTPTPTLSVPDELVFKETPGSTAASSLTKHLRSQRSPNQLSGHGNSASVQALNRFPFAMQPLSASSRVCPLSPAPGHQRPMYVQPHARPVDLAQLDASHTPSTIDQRSWLLAVLLHFRQENISSAAASTALLPGPAFAARPL
ncbi:hypothetical protein HPB50_026787 [Hyalomma asiaticum]|uniref:Uncharacterized protein n=1 Tax=Hyalomma asiaticum TaxID=266040 RepID=A0ACB7SR57_HYAAI|nr:hypothetical protein HPB50_026787 [Hyalomma asiaticum]